MSENNDKEGTTQSFSIPKWVTQLIGIIGVIVTMAIGWQQIKGTVEEQGRHIARLELVIKTSQATTDKRVAVLADQVERHRDQLAESKLADALLESKVDNLTKLAQETAVDVKKLVRRRGR